jgi:N-dimethylarginine dimethylaminohydrolase
MVFTANAGLVREDAFIPSHFKHPERRQEETPKFNLQVQL